MNFSEKLIIFMFIVPHIITMSDFDSFSHFVVGVFENFNAFQDYMISHKYNNASLIICNN